MRRISSALRLLFAVAIVFYAAQQAFPCSTFVLRGKDKLVFGANLDFFTSRGLVVVNKAGVVKTAFLAPPEKPASWVSRYGSITFNQMGREFPFGGMNEQGLVVQMMWLEDTDYPPPDERPGIQELQWIQYQLDNAATVDQVIASNSEIRISRPQAASKLHYLVCDRSGNAATIEFIEGRFVYRTGKTLPVAVLTNSTYNECLEFHNAFDSLDAGEQIMRTSYDSKDRFARIARAISDFESQDIGPAVEYAFDVLQSVSAVKRGSHCTAWSIVYDLRNMKLHFKTFENRSVRVIELDAFNFTCSSPVLVLDMAEDLSGDVSDKFVEYTPAINEDLVTSVIAAYKEAGFLTEMPDMAVQFLVTYPERLSCE
jgi:penicillin V acylase-like amidase (Ntn superfamily)